MVGGDKNVLACSVSTLGLSLIVVCMDRHVEVTADRYDHHLLFQVEGFATLKHVYHQFLSEGSGSHPDSIPIPSS